MERVFRQRSTNRIRRTSLASSSERHRSHP